MESGLIFLIEFLSKSNLISISFEAIRRHEPQFKKRQLINRNLILKKQKTIRTKETC